MKNVDYKKRSETYRRIVETKGSNFVMGSQRGEDYFVHTDLPIVIVPQPKFCSIEISCYLEALKKDASDLIDGIKNLSKIKKALQKKGYDFEGLGIRREKNYLFYEAHVSIDSNKDLEKIVSDCNSLKIS